MKKYLLLLIFILSVKMQSQAPAAFNFQASVRNDQGQILNNQNVNFKFNILINSPTSVPVFSETHSVMTDDLGIVKLHIGTGIATVGTFANVSWPAGTYYLGVELNTGNGYNAMGTAQLLSVPYALYAENVFENPALPDTDIPGSMMFYNGDEWTTINASQSSQTLFATGNGVQWGTFNTSMSDCQNSDGSLMIELSIAGESTYVGTDGQTHSQYDFDFDLEIYDEEFNVVYAEYNDFPATVQFSPDFPDGTYLVVSSLWTTVGPVPPLNPLEFSLNLKFTKHFCFPRSQALPNLWNYADGGSMQNNPDAYVVNAILIKSGTNYTVTDYETGSPILKQKLKLSMGQWKSKTQKRKLISHN